MDPRAARLAELGLDLVHPFDAALASATRGLAALAGPERRGLLVGNSRALWPHFDAAMHDPAMAALANPLDTYVERAVATVFPGARIYFGHRRYDGAFVPLQTLAVATGLGALAPNHLVIHPTLGPWFALRAVVLLAAEVLLDGEPPEPEPEPVSPVAKPCTCSDACPAALARALSGAGGEPWRAWLAVRDACSLRAARYGDEQIRYHYLKVWRPAAKIFS